MNSTNERAARWPSLSLSTSPETAKNIVNAVISGGPIEDRPRARRPVKRQGSLSNSFTTSKNAVDNRTLVGPAGTAPMPQGKKAGIFQSFRRRTMLDEHVVRNLCICVVISFIWKSITSHAYFFRVVKITSELISTHQVPDNRPIHSMANFQQIFNEMKAENPTASLGAVQHMTVMKLSKIRDQKVGEEKIRELDNNGRGSNTFVNEGRYNSIATKTMNKFVDAIRVGTFDEGENAKKSWNKSAFNESNEATSTNGEGEGLQLFQNFRRRSSNNSNSALPKRRVSQESAGARTLTDFNASEQSLNNNEHCAKARTANEMYAIAANEQGANMAPRKSISDFTAMLSVADHSDQSKGCGDSIKSDLSGLILEELARSARSLEAELDVNKGDVEDDDGSLQESGRDVLEAFTLPLARP